MRLLLFLLLAASFALANYAASRPEPLCQGSPATSCASSGCHGGGDVRRVGSEYNIWAGGDPHARAYRVLANSESTLIMTNLRRFDTEKWGQSANKTEACLVCHGPNTNACYDGEPVDAASEGVGCDSCHGPSRQWLPRHYEHTWKTLSRQQKAAYGFTDTKDLVSRTLACTVCHVGDATHNVDHDLLAAGHPRLAFEYTRFHFQDAYPKHWVERGSQRDFEVRAWFVGQVAGLRAAVALSQSRKAHPDFSEQSCFACHQTLGMPTVKFGPTPQWQPWHVALLEVLAQQTPLLFPGAVTPDLSSVVVLENLLSKPGSKTKAVATAALAALDAWLATLRQHSTASFTTAQLQSLAKAIAKSATARSDYDVLATHYLALAALAHADGPGLAEMLPTLGQLKAQLHYKPGTSGPGRYNATAVRAAFAAIESHQP